MSIGCWAIARELGLLISECSNAKTVRASLPIWDSGFSTPLEKEINEVFAGYGTIEGQLLVIGPSLTRIGAAAQLAGSTEGKRFIDAANGMAQASMVMAEWVRSRIGGYPRMLVPHVDSRGPYSDVNGIPGHRLPWTLGFRQSGIQQRPLSENLLRGFGDGELKAIREKVQTLSVALSQTEPWIAFERLRFRLSPIALDSLRVARERFWSATAPHILDMEVGRKLYTLEQYLHETLRNLHGTLPGEAAELWEAFERLDVQLEDTWHVVAQFALRGSPESLTTFAEMEWRNSCRLHLSIHTGAPWRYRLGMLVAVPPTLLPPGVCGVIRGVTLSLGPEPEADLYLNVLSDGWHQLTCQGEAASLKMGGSIL